MFVLSLNVVWA